MKRYGEQTGKFGKRLRDLFFPEYEVFYDHGNPNTDAGVAACRAFFGEKARNTNILADIDILIGKEEEAIALIEIEETSNSPKKIIGDIFAIAMCNKVKIKLRNEENKEDKPHEIYKITNETRLFIGGKAIQNGRTEEKINKIIKPGIDSFERKGDKLNLNNVSLTFCPALSKVFDKIEQEITSLLANSI